MSKVSKSSLRTGVWVRFLYDDTGARDGVVIDTSILNKYGELVVLVEDAQVKITYDQVVKVGSKLLAKYSGLD